MPHAYGWQRDTPDHRDARYAAPAALQLPQRVDLRANFPPPFNQGQLGSCTANAIAGALCFLEVKEGRPPLMPSRLFIYWNERLIEGTTQSDSGAQIRDGIKVVNAQGFCSEDEWPYDVARFAEQPPPPCYADARKDRLLSYQRLDSSEAGPLLGCLAEGYPVVFGFSVYESFETATVAGSGDGQLPTPGERVIGAHAVCAVGYDLGSRRFLIRNSWGPGWGMEGYFTLPFEYLVSPSLASDFWTLRAL